MKKRLLSLALALTLVFTFTGCEFSKGSDDAKTGEEKAAEKLEFKDAADHITYAQFNTYKLEGMGFDINLGVEGDLTSYLKDMMPGQESEKYVNFINDFVQDTKLAYAIKYKKDGEDKMPKIEGGYGLKYKGKDLINVVGLINDKNAGFSVPAVSDKGFSVDYKKLLEKEDAEAAKVLQAFLSLDLEKYLDIILGGKSAYDFYNEDLASIKEVYAKFINDSVTKTETNSVERNGKEIPVTEYKMTYDYDKAIAINKEILEAIKKDEKLRDLLIERADLVLDEIIKSKDYELFGATEEDMKEAKEELTKIKEDKDLKKKWEDGIDEIIAGYDESQNQEGVEEVKAFINNADMEYLIRINEDNKIDSGLISFVIKDEEKKADIKISAEVVSLNPDEMEFVDSTDFLDITELAASENPNPAEFFENNSEAFDYIKTYMLDAINFVLEGDSFKMVFDLMEKHEMTMEKTMIESQVKQVKTMVENMTVEQLMGM